MIHFKKFYLKVRDCDLQIKIDNYKNRRVNIEICTDLLLQNRVSPLWIQARVGLGETEMDLPWIRSFMWFCPGKTKLDLHKSS